MPTDERAACPECKTPMQPFFARRARGAPAVQLDACRACGGVWLDRGELEASLGQPVKLEPMQRHLTRRCPRCSELLHTTRCGRYVEVEHCDDCGGFFLEEGELGGLGAHAVDHAAADLTRAEVTFECVKCLGQFPMAQGNAMGDALACRKCTPGLGLLLSEGRKPEVPRHKGWFGNRFAGAGGDGTLSSIGDGFFDLFF